jgi:3-demethoxyubiquinol 3-hydroxylase
MRSHSKTELLLGELDRALRTLGAPKAQQQRATPKAGEREYPQVELSAAEKRRAAGLMRVNHAGEVAAQALYFGHAAGAKAASIKTMMLAAAAEEADHLAWCTDRLTALDARPSLFGPLWYGGAYIIGFAAAKVSDQTALGFVAETERQVEAHLKNHESELPADDADSLAVVQAMRADEAAHGRAALAAGGQHPRWPIPGLMQKAADVMRWVAARI